VLLLAALGGCKIFHPYRLPTPKPSPEFKAQQKEAEARKKASNLTDSPFNKKKKAAPAEEEAATDVSTPSGGAIAAPPAATPEARKLPERSTVRYDKHGMMKKPKLMRRRRHNKHGQPFRPIESIRNFFKFGLHAKPNYSPDHKPAPKQPSNADLPDEAMPEPKAEPAPAGDKP
jgi:hypothetical protein